MKVVGAGGQGALFERGGCLILWPRGGRLIGEERLLECVRLFEEMRFVLFEKKGLKSFSERPN